MSSICPQNIRRVEKLGSRGSSPNHCIALVMILSATVRLRTWGLDRVGYKTDELGWKWLARA